MHQLPTSNPGFLSLPRRPGELVHSWEDRNMAEYNGWTNYETWLANLWLGNDQPAWNTWQSKDGEAGDAYRNAKAERPFSRREKAVLDLAKRLQEEHEAEWDEIMEAAGRHVHLSSSVWADLMSAALSEVDWHAIAEHYIDNIAAEVDAEEAASA